MNWQVEFISILSSTPTGRPQHWLSVWILCVWVRVWSAERRENFTVSEKKAQAWLKALPWGRVPLSSLCNAFSSANRRQLGLINSHVHIQGSLWSVPREKLNSCPLFSVWPHPPSIFTYSPVNPRIPLSSKVFFFGIAPLTWIGSQEFWGVCKLSAALSPVFFFLVSVQAPSREVF